MLTRSGSVTAETVVTAARNAPICSTRCCQGSIHFDGTTARPAKSTGLRRLVLGAGTERRARTVIMLPEIVAVRGEHVGCRSPRSILRIVVAMPGGVA